MLLYRLTSCLRKRRRFIFMVTGCTAVSGLLLVNQIMPITSTSCSNDSQEECHSPSYQFLKRNEITIQVEHPLISSVHVNFLPSNSPNEDRYSLASLPNDCTSLFAVIDGHKSADCSEYLKHNLLPYVTNSLIKGGVVKGPLNMYKEGDQFLRAESTESCDLVGSHDDVPGLLRQGFNELDKNISQEGLRIVQLLKSGRSINEEGMLPTIMKALAGACALVAMVTRSALYIASTGDCRAVIGVKVGGEIQATPLSVDQNVNNNEEVSRVKNSHPKDEENSVIVFGRLLGSLQPLRSFGDNDYKWDKEILEHLMLPIAPNYNTPPYLTAEPVVTNHSPKQGHFMILATDGLWDKLSNQEAVDVVSQSVGLSKSSTSIFDLFRRKDTSSSINCCNDNNSATHLLWKALGGSESSVHASLNIEPASLRRMHRDDITIIVVHFK